MFRNKTFRKDMFLLFKAVKRHTQTTILPTLHNGDIMSYVAFFILKPLHAIYHSGTPFITQDVYHHCELYEKVRDL